MTKNYFIKSITFCICFLPISLNAGAAISEFFNSLTALLFLSYTLIYKDWHYYKKKIFIFLLIFNIYLIFGSLISEFKLNSLSTSVFYFRHTITLLAVWFVLDNNKEFPKYFLISIIVPLTASFLYSLYQVFDPSLLKQRQDYFRISAFFGQELVQGGYFLRFIMIFVGIYLLAKNEFKNQIIYYFILFASIFVILVSGERSAIALLVIFLFLFLIFTDINFNKKLLIIFFSIIIVSTSIFFFQGLKERVFDNTKQLIYENHSFKAFSRGHQEHFISAIQMFKKNIFTGVGVRNFRLECRKDEFKTIGVNACTTHPHNTYIQFLAETGLIGLAFIVLFFIYVTRFLINNFFKILKKEKIYEASTIFAITIFVNLFPITTTGNFFNNWLSPMYYLPVAFFFYSVNNSK